MCFHLSFCYPSTNYVGVTLFLTNLLENLLNQWVLSIYDKVLVDLFRLFTD